MSKILWVVPLAGHLAYVTASARQLPALMGGELGGDTVSSVRFLLEWIGLVALANGAFLALRQTLPRLPARWLKVPGHEYWLASAEGRLELIARLRFVIEAVLLCLNVFLLAVFQLIYESSVRYPIVYVEPYRLMALFMALPILAALALTGMVWWQLGRDARSAALTKEKVDR